MLFDSFSLRSLPLANRTVMNPMTRSRAVQAATPAVARVVIR
jgi:N-ethylmaleimide reductase